VSGTLGLIGIISIVLLPLLDELLFRLYLLADTLPDIQSKKHRKNSDNDSYHPSLDKGIGLYKVNYTKEKGEDSRDYSQAEHQGKKPVGIFV